MGQTDNETQVRRIQESASADERRELLGQLWTGNIKLIRRIIRKVTGCAIYEDDFKDLEQQAYFGFYDAVMCFDSSFGVKFFSYAEIHIHRVLNRYYNHGGMIRIPEYMRQQIRDYMTAKVRLEIKLGSRATQEEVFEVMRFSPAARKGTMAALQRMEVESLDRMPDNNEVTSILYTLAASDDVETEATKKGYHEELHNILTAAIASTSDTQKAMIYAHWQQLQTYAEIAAACGCTPENVRQHIEKGFKRIRKGKYARGLLTFLPDRAIKRAKRNLRGSFQELSEKERGLLM